jgi:cytochrome c oxidase subunit II
MANLECHPVRTRLLALTGLLACLALTTAGAAAAGAGFQPVTSQSPNDSRIDSTYWFVFGFAVAIFILVEVALVVFIVRYRSRGRGRDVEGAQVHGHARLELLWTAVPVLILVAVAVFTFYELPGIKNVPRATAAGNQIDVRVFGRQFYWEFTYPNGAVAVNTMRAPLNRVVYLNVTSPRFDVIHSWWVPALGGKIDAIPGNVNHTWFDANATGTFHGRCAEFCGLLHASMASQVQVLQPARFIAWVNKRASDPIGSGLGRETFQGVCAKCHGMQGQGGIGPVLTGNPLITQRAGMTKLLETGGTTMPPVGRGWPRSQLNALLDYLSTDIAKQGSGGG